MANQRLVQLLSLTFISGCFCVGIALGVSIRRGEWQVSQVTTVASEPELLPPESEPEAEPEKTVLDTVVIVRFVG